MTGRITKCKYVPSEGKKIAKGAKTYFVVKPIQIIVGIETDDGKTHEIDVAPVLRATLAQKKKFLTNRKADFFCRYLLGQRVDCANFNVLNYVIVV